MARARNIKPGFFGNDLLAEIDPLGRLLFIGLWTIVDREGRMEDRPKRIRAAVLPFDNCDIDALLADLARLGFIIRYEAEGGRFIQVVNWHKHQNPHFKEVPSIIPPCNQDLGLHEPKASDKPQFCPNPAPTQPQPSPADSGFRIPDSGFMDSRQQQGASSVEAPKASGLSGAGLGFSLDEPPGDDDETPSPGENPPPPSPIADAVTTRAVEIAVLLRKRGAGVAAGDPRLRSWAERGITDAALLTALETAEKRREAAGNAQPVNAGLLDVILADARSPPRGSSSGIPWWSTDQTVLAEGRKRGIEPRPGESMAQFKGRVSEKVGQAEAEGAAA